MDPVAKELLNYGVLGIVVVVLAGVVRFLYKEMKVDRAEAKTERETMRITVEGNTGALQEIRRLFERK